MINKSAGFTLLEVMVALGICAMAGIAAMQVTGEHVSHIASIEEQTYASWVAENRLVMIRAQGDKWNGKNNNNHGDHQAGSNEILLIKLTGIYQVPVDHG